MKRKMIKKLCLSGFQYAWVALLSQANNFYVQGVQRIYGRFCKYKAINQKLNNQALRFLTFYNQDYLEMLIQKRKPIFDERYYDNRQLFTWSSVAILFATFF